MIATVDFNNSVPIVAIASILLQVRTQKKKPGRIYTSERSRGRHGKSIIRAFATIMLDFKMTV